MSKETSQSAKILWHLQNIGPVTALQAIDLFNCMRLAARVEDLRKEGHPIVTDMKRLKNGKKIAVYSIPKIQKQGELFQ